MEEKEKRIIEFLEYSEGESLKEIFIGVAVPVSYATLKRILINLISKNYLCSKGKGKGTKYFLSSAYKIIKTVDMEVYYGEEIR